ncbi:MAG: T9SS type A sorting domain-containing protein [Calditrichaeota bacterium]|nr:T9SS type A sorting domain-containing protein [Calditrichota bacterium]
MRSTFDGTNRHLLVLAVLVILTTLNPAHCDEMSFSDTQVSIIASSGSSIDIEFLSSDLDAEEMFFNSQTIETIAASGIGFTYEYGKPRLPMVSRFVIVPAEAGLELTVESVNQHRSPAENHPIMTLDENLCADQGPDDVDVEELYPSVVAEMSEPSIVRGVRMVKVTTYPVQYNSRTEEYIHNENIRTKISFTNKTPVNPVEIPFNDRQHKSREFLKYINAIALNGASLDRDDGTTISPYAGHYLIVTNRNLLNAAREFVEWRRKAGYKVDIIALSNADCRSSATIKNEIQAVYDSYIDDGFDPFDNLLLIGDLDYGRNGNTETLLESHFGETGWSGNHADYKYALLEGNDLHMETAVARWCAGNDDIVGLFSGRLIAYEAEPNMRDREWFSRGSVGSYHWGNQEESAWYVSIHTNVRYGLQVLDRLGYEDIRFYEDYDWDRGGDNYDPWISDQYDDGVNIILSRAESYNFRESFRGIDYNDRFPVMINYSGHGEMASWTQMRSGDRERMRGPASITLAWGDPTTLTMNTVWLNNVQGVLVEDLSFGWGWVYAVTNIEKCIPNHQIDSRRGQRQWFYPLIKTDTDVYGDPGLQVWRGIPMQIDVEHIDVITPETSSLKILVFDPINGEVPVRNARVCLYIPGRLPDNASEYAEHQVFQVSTTTGTDGTARFVFDGEDFDEGTMYVTVTGRDIAPAFSEIHIEPHAESIDLASYTMIETVGDGDEDVNPGEIFLLSLTAVNHSENTGQDSVTAVVTSLSQWIEVSDDTFAFGNIPAGDVVNSEHVAAIQIHQSCPDGETNGEKPELVVEFHSRNRIWKSIIQLNPVSANFRVIGFPDGEIIAVDAQELDIEIENFGYLGAGEITARLEAVDSGVNILNGEALYPGLNAGESGTIEGDPFRIAGHEITVPGSAQELRMILTTENGFIDTVRFIIQVDEARRNAPHGPDEHGYICFDDSDEDWYMAPVYDWIEINPSDEDFDYEGFFCHFDGRSEYDVGEVEVVDMGMTFQFYGELFSCVSIFSNGYIVPGDHETAMNFQNFPMEQGFGGGMGMIAPFWDWLDINNDSRVFYYHDDDGGRFIIQYDRLNHHLGGGEDLTFQVILYDNEIWHSQTGDQDVLFQYKSISQSRGVQVESEWSTNVPYASVGISSVDGKTGIGYTFNNEYPVTSEPMRNRQAILFTTSLFPTGPVPPTNFSLMFPSDGAVLNSTVVNFYWERSIDINPGDNVTYSLIIETDEQLVQLETEINSIEVETNNIEIPLEILINEGAFWRVIAYGGADSVDSNERYRFGLSPSIETSERTFTKPTEFGLTSIHPNPVNGPATVQFGINLSGQVNLNLYDLKGRQTESIVNHTLQAGNHTITWHTAHVPAGLYLMRLEAGGKVNVEKVAVVK